MPYILVATVVIIFFVLFLLKSKSELSQLRKNAESAYNQFEDHMRLCSENNESASVEKNECYRNMVNLSTRIFNETAHYYNRKCKQFPFCIAAVLFGFRPLKKIRLVHK